MNDDFEKPYRKIAAAEEQLERGALLDYYVKLYKQRYRAEPIFPVTAVTQTQIKDLQRIMKDKAYDTLTAYFKMKDDWFEKQHFSLDCLLKNLSKVNVQVTKAQGVAKAQGKISIQIYCDSCWNEFNLICDMHFDFLNKPVRCEPCYAQDAPLKRVSKQERHGTITRLGSAFPEMPK